MPKRKSKAPRLQVYLDRRRKGCIVIRTGKGKDVIILARGHTVDLAFCGTSICIFNHNQVGKP